MTKFMMHNGVSNVCVNTRSTHNWLIRWRDRIRLQYSKYFNRYENCGERVIKIIGGIAQYDITSEGENVLHNE